MGRIAAGTGFRSLVEVIAGAAASAGFRNPGVKNGFVLKVCDWFIVIIYLS